MIDNVGLYLLANAYSSFSPALATAANCTVNGEAVPCSAGFVGGVLAIVGGLWFIMLGVMVLTIIGFWKIYTKAGRPGWASLVPVYNIIVLLEIIGKPTWWVILSFIPFVNAVVGIIVTFNLAKVFGKGTGYTLGMIFLPFIFYPMLGFGSASYIGAKSPTVSPVASL